MKLPLTDAEFLNVAGVGEHKLQKYGVPFIQRIIEFCEEHPERQPVMNAVAEPVRKPAKKTVGDSHLETYKLHQAGKTVADIAAERELVESTVENHLIQCIQQGMEVDYDLLIPAEHIEGLERAWQKPAATD
ncbi:ATP-dependent DNA helicase [Mesobacillus boroniphilus JCM 21738]|uniref:ATP-dependent DNA helicase n=1 Tax=Mesobacillus boroniphilus JCM 21738 TaxID=1294265 RepID=W4RQS3_9BACI|nr:ATP-dependent DNA helicase [Mesobacillus boroniphilus JCM 21738]